MVGEIKEDVYLEGLALQNDLEELFRALDKAQGEPSGVLTKVYGGCGGGCWVVFCMVLGAVGWCSIMSCNVSSGSIVSCPPLLNLHTTPMPVLISIHNLHHIIVSMAHVYPPYHVHPASPPPFRVMWQLHYVHIFR